MPVILSGDVLHSLQTKQDLLYQLTRDLARASDMRTVAQQLFRGARQALGADHGLLMLADATGLILQGVDSYGLDLESADHEQINIQDELAPVSLAFQQKQPIIISNMPNQLHLSERLRKKYPFVRNAWAVPLMNGEKAIGALVLGYEVSREATTEDLRFLQVLGDEAALAIERTRLTEELRNSEAQYRELVENARDIILSISLKGLFTRVNAAVEVILGWKPQEMIGQHYRKFLPPTSIATMAQRERLLTAGTKIPAIFEIEALHKDGGIVPLEALPRLIRDQAGKPSNILVILRDIQERKRTEAIIQAEGDILRALARVSQELISVLNTPLLLERFCRITAEVLDADYSHTRLFEPKENAYVTVAGYGETPQQTEARHAFKVPPERFTRLFARFEKEHVIARTTEEIRDPVEQSVLRHLGIATVLYFPLRRNDKIIGLQSVWYRTGKVVHPHYMRIVQSISQIASLALTNALLFQELEQTNQLKEDFIGSVSHELRTPLHIIMGYLELLQEQSYGPLNDPQQHTLGRIHHNAKELLDLINATLDLSRLQNSRVPTLSQQIDIEALFTELEAEGRQFTPKTSVDIHWQVDRTLPTISTDPVKLRMILKNLLTNAIKFTEHGKIAISAGCQGNQIVFSVRDTGIGIAPEALPFIFEPFRQAEPSSSQGPKGVGLGLYIVRQLTTLLEGDVSVTSTVGKGSTFQVTLPLRLRQQTSAPSFLPL